MMNPERLAEIRAAHAAWELEEPVASSGWKYAPETHRAELLAEIDRLNSKSSAGKPDSRAPWDVECILCHDSSCGHNRMVPEAHECEFWLGVVDCPECGA